MQRITLKLGDPTVLIAGALLVVGACHKDSQQSAGVTSPSEDAAAEAPLAPVAACSVAPLQWKWPGARPVVAVGDVHGDKAALSAALSAAGLVDGAGDWQGGNTVLVQTGDILDRGDDEVEVFAYFDALRVGARRAGGDVVVLNGNHELMNAAGDFRYVTPGGFRDFGGRTGRARAFAPGGKWARTLSRQPVIAMVGDSLFVHGGVLMEHTAVGIESLNRDVQCWLVGARDAPTQVIASDVSPVWTRVYGGDNPPCDELSSVLENLGARRLVVGHTPQKESITSACGEKLWRIDVGMAAAYGGVPAVLELKDESAVIRAVSKDSDSPSAR